MSSILSRQNINNPNDYTYVEHDDDLPFWYTRTGHTVKWLIFLGIIVLIFGLWMIGHMHARRRINKGLAPLPYHRWMLSRQQRAKYDPSYRDPSPYYYPPHQGDGYHMHAMPPPVYDPRAPMPPVYQPPTGASKVDPSQWTSRPAAGADSTPSYEASYQPPAGPPPTAAAQTTHNGMSSASNSPFRV